MLKLWKINLTVLIFQLLVGTVSYYFTSSAASAVFAAFVATLGAFAVFAVTFNDSSVASLAVILAAASTAAFAITFTARFNSSAAPLATTLVTIITLTAFLAAKETKENGADEAIALLFPTALPAGIGTVIGGIILLIHHLRRKGQTERLFD